MVRGRSRRAGLPRRVRGLLAEAERRSEAVLACLRLLSFVALLVVLRVFDLPGHGHVLATSLLVYGGMSMAGVALALRRIYRPWLPWAFATLDVAMILHFMGALAVHDLLPGSGTLAAPEVFTIFLFLAQAGLRFRPMLVLYTLILFLAGWLGLVLWSSRDAAFGLLRDPAELTRAAVLVMTTLTVYLVTIRTRGLLLDALRSAALNRSMARFVPPHLVDELADGEFAAEATREQQVAILFVDVRGFTSLAETLSPAETMRFLGEYRRRLSRPIAAHGGIIDKFIGDAIMVVFGLPQPTRADAGRALSCGLGMLDAVAAWNEERAAQGRPPVQIGVGIHCGPAVVGILDAGKRSEYTVVGDTVNTAQRIERLCAELGLPLLASQELKDAAALVRPNQRWQLIPGRLLRGRQAPLDLYGLAAR